MKVLLTGKNGQVGWELERSLPRPGLSAFDRAGLDLADSDQIVARVRDAKPDVIINAAAYTAVDRAESEPELAMRINGTAPGILAAEAKRLGALLIHYSTDYVFDGSKQAPYDETDAPNPINAYGTSKLQGERAIQASGCRYLILRTSWVYGTRGRNFLLAVLRKANEVPALNVVDDQVGAPTWCRDIAAATARLVRTSGAQEMTGLYHLASAGATSWCGFARTILKMRRIVTPVLAIASSQYPTAAKRPGNSVLSSERLSRDAGVALPDWEASLDRCLGEDQAQ